MDTKEIIKFWHFPSETIINKNIPKLQIYKHLKSNDEKNYLQDKVKSIYLLASYKTNNTNIPKFESEQELYSEIEFFYIEAKQALNKEKVYKILTKTIPYPLVILFEENDRFIFYFGKFSKLSNGFLKLEQFYNSLDYDENQIRSILSKLNFSKLDNINFKVLYESMISILSTDAIKNNYEKDVKSISGEDKNRIDELNKEISDLKKDISKEHQINLKIEMQMKRKVLEEEINNILNRSMKDE